MSPIATGATPNCRQDHGAAVLAGGVDLLEAVVAGAQGEQDPRCLLLVFRAVRSLVALLAGGGPQSAARLDEVCSRGCRCFLQKFTAVLQLHAAQCRRLVATAAGCWRYCSFDCPGTAYVAVSSRIMYQPYLDLQAQNQVLQLSG